MKPLSWLTDKFKSKKGETPQNQLAPAETERTAAVGGNWGAVTEVPQWNPGYQEADYPRTQAVFDAPQWNPDVPAAPAFQAEDYAATVAVFDPPAWEPEVPERTVPAQQSDYAANAAIFDVPQWAPDVPTVPAFQAEDYAATVAVFDAPAWAPEESEKTVPARKEPDYVPAEEGVTVPQWKLDPPVPQVEDYEATVAVFDAPAWAPEEPERTVPARKETDYVPAEEGVTVPQWKLDAPVAPAPQVEDYEATVAVFDAPAWVPEEPEKTVPAQKQPELDEAATAAIFDVPQWEPDVPAAPVSQAEDYAATVAVFDPPAWEPEEPAMTVPVQKQPEPEPVYEQTVPVVQDRAEVLPQKPKAAVAAPEWDATLCSGAVREPLPTQPVNREEVRSAVHVPERKPESLSRSREMTGRSAVPPVQEPKFRQAPVSEAPKSVVREAPKAAPAPRKASVAVKPKPATPIVADMKTPEVPDFGRTMSSEVCDFTLGQQWHWLDRLHEVIPTLRMGTEPACVDYPLTLRNMKAAGDMRITVKRVAMGVGTMLSITNLENAVTCKDVAKLREASQILAAYGKMVSGRQADAIRMTIRFLGVRVAELQGF